MSGGVPDIICDAQTTFKFVDHALIIDNRGLLLFKSENLANLPGLKNGFNLDTNVSAQSSIFFYKCYVDGAPYCQQSMIYFRKFKMRDENFTNVTVMRGRICSTNGRKTFCVKF